MIQNQKEVEEIIEYYAGVSNPSEQDNLVSMLREIQEVEGCIPADARQMAAEKMGIKTSILDCIIRIYPSLKAESYSHEILVCTGERCGKKNSMEFLHMLQKELQISKDGISKDKKIRLVTRNCLKQCRTSPNMYVDGVLYSGMTKEKVQALIEKLRK